jgi:ATP-dependent Clp protease protease subunit
MIHQPSGGAFGTVSDVKISVKEIETVEKELYLIIAEKTGRTYEEVVKDCDRDYWMSAEEALSYGIITKIL